MHLIVYSALLTPRIKYIFNFIFKDILQTEIEFTLDKKYFLENENIKICYADVPCGDALFFKNSALLSSNKVEELTLKTVSFGEYKVPFPVQQSSLPFDVFAASFFILSRYEEYLHQKKSDKEFKAHDSHQYKWKLLDRPVIDEWALILKNMIRKKHPSFKFREKEFFHQPTINFVLRPDVPVGFFPKTKFIFASVVNKKQKFLSSVFDDLTGLGINWPQILSELNILELKCRPVYFINFPEDEKHRFKYQKSMEFFKEKTVGILSPHVSDKEKSGILKAELLLLKEFQGNHATLMSQQLEILKLPACYLHLLGAGIISDYSMGYSQTLGFRAGTCTPFNWYDLELEKVTPINVKSYSVSDSALQSLNISDAKKAINDYIDTVKLVRGHFYSSWQIKSLSENVKFKKWKVVFNEMLKYAGS